MQAVDLKRPLTGSAGVQWQEQMPLFSGGTHTVILPQRSPTNNIPRKMKVVIISVVHQMFLSLPFTNMAGMLFLSPLKLARLSDFLWLITCECYSLKTKAYESLQNGPSSQTDLWKSS